MCCPWGLTCGAGTDTGSSESGERVELLRKPSFGGDGDPGRSHRIAARRRELESCCSLKMRWSQAVDARQKPSTVSKQQLAAANHSASHVYARPPAHFAHMATSPQDAARFRQARPLLLPRPSLHRHGQQFIGSSLNKNPPWASAIAAAASPCPILRGRRTRQPAAVPEEDGERNTEGVESWRVPPGPGRRATPSAETADRRDLVGESSSLEASGLSAVRRCIFARIHQHPLETTGPLAISDSAEDGALLNDSASAIEQARVALYLLWCRAQPICRFSLPLGALGTRSALPAFKSFMIHS